MIQLRQRFVRFLGEWCRCGERRVKRRPHKNPMWGCRLLTVGFGECASMMPFSTYARDHLKFHVNSSHTIKRLRQPLKNSIVSGTILCSCPCVGGRSQYKIKSLHLRKEFEEGFKRRQPLTPRWRGNSNGPGPKIHTCSSMTTLRIRTSGSKT